MAIVYYNDIKIINVVRVIDIKEHDLNYLISGIISSYEENSKTPRYLPDKAEVIHLVEILQRILFPGYFDEDDYDDPKEHVGNLLSEASDILQKQICRALNLDGSACECGNKFEQAGELCRSFLSKLPEIRSVLLTDIRAAFDGDPAAQNEHEIIFAYPGITAVSIYRLAHQLYSLYVPLVPRMMTEYAHSLTGIDIHPGAKIGRYFFIDHGTGVVIGETTEIGDYVKIYQGVTLGALSTRGGQTLRGAKRHPTLEDEVTVYSGASILGGETIIGKGCVVGGNAFITQSVPAGTKVSRKDNN